MTAFAHRRRTPLGAGSLLLRSPQLVFFITASVVLVGLAVSASPSLSRAAVAACVAAFLMVSCLRFPRASLIGLVVWLGALGTVRRLFLGAVTSGSQDPFLLVAPAAIVVLVTVAAGRGAFRQRSPLTNGVLVLTGLVLTSTFNPLQGGVSIGAAALLFALFPLLWFWIGRALTDDALLWRILSLVSVVAAAAACYGLFQVYRGFPPWDAEWIAVKGYSALSVGDATRPFASFSNTSEYVTFVAIGGVVWFLRVRQLRGVLIGLPVIAVIAWALSVASVRSIAVLLLVTVALVYALSRGIGALKSTGISLIALVVFGVAISTLDPSGVGGTRTSSLLGRQVTGLADPFNSDQSVSTLPLHLQLIGNGLRTAIRNPIGSGFGSVTIAGVRFGGETASTEADPSNIAVALGIPGLLAYVWVVYFGLRLAFRRARSERSLLPLAAVGVLVVTSLQWLTGGNYATALFPWLILGWLDRPIRLSERSQSPQLQASAPENAPTDGVLKCELNQAMGSFVSSGGAPGVNA